jgi:hypothetical protein
MTGQESLPPLPTGTPGVLPAPSGLTPPPGQLPPPAPGWYPGTQQAPPGAQPPLAIPPSQPPGLTPPAPNSQPPSLPSNGVAMRDQCFAALEDVWIF